MEDEGEVDPDADINRLLRQFGLPPVSSGGWDDPSKEGWEDDWL